MPNERMDFLERD